MEKEQAITTHANLFTEASAIVLAFVFLYTTGSKWLDMEATREAFMNQPFPKRMGLGLAYILPAVEFVSAILLLLPSARKIGFGIALLLMGAFTGYVALVLTGIFGRIPCSCGGIVSALGWGEHLILNIALLTIAILGYRASKNIRTKINNQK
jgi:hypothetical protein